MPISKIKGSAINDGAINSDRLDDGTIVAVDLASEAVNTSKMSGLTGTSSGFIKADGDGTMSVATADLVDDTTPQLGGNLDGNGNTIDLSGNTDALTLPQGTTAQEPAAASYTGAIRYNTDEGVVMYSDGTDWYKIAAQVATLDSVTGNIIAGLSTTLTLAGSGFLTANLVVNFTQASDGIDEDVTVTPTSDTAATVSVPSAVYNSVTGGNVVTIKVTNSDGMSSDGVNKTAIGLPSGGTLTTSGNYRIHTFTSSSTLVVPTGFSATAEYLIVGGGAGGGRLHGGGGGAGGMLTGSTSISAQTYTITVGAGGAAASSSSVKGTNGVNSSALGLTAIGGGGGNSRDAASAGSGGSGGGGKGTGSGSSTGGSGTSGQGNDGGDGLGAGSGAEGGGGGGGAGAAGSNGTAASGGNGGGGTSSSISGSSVTYAGGGGGGSTTTSGSYPAGSGGSGGGGAGGDGCTAAGNGSANTGAGGGGSGYNPACTSGGVAGNGGSGIVIIRYDVSGL